MCGYFRPIVVDVKNPSEILQPSQIAFITWDPESKTETVSVQPRFEGNALDFGMVIPTPSQPKLHEMPRDFFKALAVLTKPKHRAFPQSKLMPFFGDEGGFGGGRVLNAKAPGGLGAGLDPGAVKPPTVQVVEVGQVGNLDYKIIAATRGDDLFAWLKDNKYSFAGDEATLNFYVQKKYFFTVMKIDTLQMKKNADGTYTGDVTPTRFTFTSDRLVYPLKITQVSVKDKTDAMFYVQAPFKADLEGEMTYEYQWVSNMQQVQGNLGPNELTATNQAWFKAIQAETPALMKQSQQLGFNIQLGQPVQPNAKGRIPSTLEWAKKLTAADIEVVMGNAPYSETLLDPDAGFSVADMRDPQRAAAIMKVIQRRLEKSRQDRPRGYLVREASREELALLPILKGHLQAGQYLTKFNRVFTRGEMNDDLVLVPAKVGDVADVSEHEELLRMVGGRGPGFPGGGLPPPGFKLRK
jgi:hypothetical protein